MDMFDGRSAEIVEYLRESCLDPVSALEFFELECTEEDIETLMFANNYERCPSCGWWVERFELVPEDAIDNEPDGCCGNCRVTITE